MELNQPDIPPGTILDYASPIARSPLRLARKSILTQHYDDTGFHVYETLHGKLAAISAIVFCGSSMITLGLAVFGSRSALPVEIFYGFADAGVVALILALINQNWRETILDIGPQNLDMTFKTPFKTHIHRWTWDQVVRPITAKILDPHTQRIVCELQIVIHSSPLVRLFTGHDIPELSPIADEIGHRIAEMDSNSQE